ncbi:hypothetical protein vseg_001826 [Gypsophila vaccaria]
MDYVGGILYLKTDVFELCYFRLVETVKAVVKCDDLGELWYRRPGLSLFCGKKRIQSDKNIEQLMATNDSNGYVNVYVIDNSNSNKASGDPTNSLLTSSGPEGTCENEWTIFGGINEVDVNPTSTLFPTAATSSHTPSPKNTFLQRLPKLPFIRTKNPSISLQVADDLDCVEEDGTKADTDDPDVSLSGADGDDSEYDDLFIENVDDSDLESVERDLNQLRGAGQTNVPDDSVF